MATSRGLLACAAGLVGTGLAQQTGSTKTESPPPMGIAACTVDGGCELEVGAATLDANWRWTHSVANGQAGGNCYDRDAWSVEHCEDPEKCSASCGLEGVDAADYKNTYGVEMVPGGLRLGFVSMGAGGVNVGSRLYFMDTQDTYKLFKLKNREFTFDVDVSNLPCGINGALYFSEMDADGGVGGGNKAGAAYGTGYCDAQCPHDVKFQKGVANVLKWNKTDTTGSLGACCAEMDIWEANGVDAAYTPHPCEHEGTYICTGKECGDIKTGERYLSVCDKDGCDFNSYRMGEKNFFGDGADFDIDSSKPLTVVTQFITSDNTDEGDLVEIRRLYVQGGKVIENTPATILGADAGNSITEEFCATAKEKFGDPNKFKEKGGLKSMGDALGRGMVLVMSLWDDIQDHMLWLDSEEGRPADLKSHHVGVERGPCSRKSGVPSEVRQQYPDSYVTFYNVMYGEIDSTYTAGDVGKPEALQEASAEWKAAKEKHEAPAAPPVQPQQVQQQQQQQVVQQVVKQSSGGGACSTAYGQCAGPEGTYTGATCCEGGCTCQGTTSGPGAYAQCVPPAGAYLCPGTVQQSEVVDAPLSPRSPLRAATAVAAAMAAAAAVLAGALVVRRWSRPQGAGYVPAELDGLADPIAAREVA